MAPSERWPGRKTLAGAVVLWGLGLAVGWWTCSLIGSTEPRGVVSELDVDMPFDGWEREAAPTNGVLLPDHYDVEAQEHRLVSVSLADENAALQGRVDDLTKQADQLMRELAERRVEVDLLRVEQEQAVKAGGVMAGSTLSVSRLSLVDVSEEQGLVALGGGAVEGVKVGMRFHVVRDDRRIAGVKVVEVRERLAAAVIEDPGGVSLLESDYAIPVRPESR